RVDAGEGGRGIKDVLEDIDHDHRVIACGLERQLFERALEDGEPARLAGIRDIALGSLHALHDIASRPEVAKKEAAAAAHLEDETGAEAGQLADEGHAPAITGLVEAAPLDGLQKGAEGRASRRGLERVVARVQGGQLRGRGQGVEDGRAAIAAADEATSLLVDAVGIADALVERVERRGAAEETGHQSLRASSLNLTRWTRNSLPSSRRPILAAEWMARRRRHISGKGASADLHARRM